MNENYLDIDELILAFLNEKITLEEKNNLQHWIGTNSSNLQYFQQIYKIWMATQPLKMGENDVENVLTKLKFILNKADDSKQNMPKLTKNKYFEFLKWAAVIFLSIICGIVLTFIIGIRTLNETSKFANTEIVVPLGSKSTIQLPDGTLVMLNAGSTLKYKIDFGRTDRIVQFEGEGYFKVAKDPAKPFKINTSDITIKALGTEFNVKAYASDNTIETTLVEGSVKIEQHNKSFNTEMILKPNQKLTLYKETNSFVKSSTLKSGKSENNQIAEKGEAKIVPRPVTENVDVNPIVSWKDKRWIIDKIDLANLAIDLERKFDVHIHFESDRLKTFRFTGTLQDEPIEQILKVISVTAPINYKFNGKDVTLYEKSNYENIYNNLYKKVPMENDKNN